MSNTSLQRADNLEYTFSRPNSMQLLHCVIMENGFSYEMGLPQSGIDRFQDEVPFPTFIGSEHPADILSDQVTHYRMHFLSQVAIRHVCTALHQTLHGGRNGYAVETPTNFGVPQPVVMKELARQTEFWRESLPRELQWNDDKSSFSTREFESEAPGSSSNFIDVILHARLQTRYHYVKYCNYRPYIYKALHYPNECSMTDLENCAVCLKICCNWPIYLFPSTERTRLLPYQFMWTQNLLGILLIFHMTNRNPILRDIRAKYLVNNEIEESTVMIMNWIQDMKEIDGIAQWAWEIAKELLVG